MYRLWALMHIAVQIYKPQPTTLHVKNLSAVQPIHRNTSGRKEIFFFFFFFFSLYPQSVTHCPALSLSLISHSDTPKAKAWHLVGKRLACTGTWVLSLYFVAAPNWPRFGFLDNKLGPLKQAAKRNVAGFVAELRIPLPAWFIVQSGWAPVWPLRKRLFWSWNLSLLDNAAEANQDKRLELQFA